MYSKNKVKNKYQIPNITLQLFRHICTKKLNDSEDKDARKVKSRVTSCNKSRVTSEQHQYNDTTNKCENFQAEPAKDKINC